MLSPLLFIVSMDKIPKDANLDLKALNELLFFFADDQSILNENKEELQRHMDSLNSRCEEHGMKISTQKTEVMSVGCTSDKLDITIKIQLLI